MQDPPRLLDEDPAFGVATLIAAARAEQPSSGAVLRALDAASSGASSAGTSGAAPADPLRATSSTSISGGAVAGLGGAAVIGLGVAAWIAFGRVPSPPPALLAAQPTSAVLSPGNAAAPSSITLQESGPVRARPETNDAAGAAERRVSPDARTQRPASKTRAPSAADSLAEEARLLESARSALEQGALMLGEQALREHSARYPRAKLLPEALELELELYERRGESERAVSLAQRLVAEFPGTPASSRARALLDDHALKRE